MGPYIKPQVSYITEETLRNYANNGYSGKKYKTVFFKTYRELVKNLKPILEETTESYIYIGRSRRGLWGEWFEWWALVNGEPTIIKSGWQ